MPPWYSLLLSKGISIYDSCLQMTLVVVFHLRNVNILDQRLIIALYFIPNLHVKVLAHY